MRNKGSFIGYPKKLGLHRVTYWLSGRHSLNLLTSLIYKTGRIVP